MTEGLNLWQRWLKQPQTIWLRRGIFQIHLWAGIAIGVYVLVTSISGSAVVFKPEIIRAFTPQRTVEITGSRLDDDQLRAAAARAHPDHQLTAILRPRQNRRIPDPVPVEKRAIELWLERDGETVRRLFDPYTGADLGSATSPVIVAVNWIQDLHVNLLSGETGRAVNGAAGALFTAVALTGLMVWWPGIRSWRRGLTVQWKASWRRLNWDLHSAAGFWTFLFVAMWGVTGVIVCFPVPFYDLLNIVNPPVDNEVQELGDFVFRWSARIHFGSFAWPVKILWFTIGLSPAFLFITGALMWWSRVVKPSIEKSARKSEPESIGLMR